MSKFRINSVGVSAVSYETPSGKVYTLSNSGWTEIEDEQDAEFFREKGFPEFESTVTVKKKGKETEIVPGPNALTNEEYLAKLRTFKGMPESTVQVIFEKYPTWDYFVQNATFDDIDKLPGISKAEAKAIMKEIGK